MNNAKYEVQVLDGDIVEIDIIINLENDVNRVSPKLIKYLSKELYKKSKDKFEELDYTDKKSNLMSENHIRWEYALHLAGYGLLPNCDDVRLNVGENFSTLMKRLF